MCSSDLPFSAAENFLRGAIGGTASNRARKKKQASKEEMGDGGSVPSPFITREGQPAPPTIAGNDGFPFMSPGLVKSCSCRGSVGKRRRPRPINRHASTEVAGFWSPRCSVLDPWLRREAKPDAPWARGLLSAFWERGSPDLPACGPRCAEASRPYGPSSSTKHPRPSRGSKPREADDARPPPERPSQAGSRGAEISRRGKPHEALVT